MTNKILRIMMITAISTMSAISAMGSGSEAVDPMLPKDFAPKENIESEPAAGGAYSASLGVRVGLGSARSDFDLAAIAISDHTAYCIINDRLLTINDVISGYKLVKITTKSVVLEDGRKQTKVLTMK